MSNRHELGNMIFNLEERKNLKEVKFTKSAVKEVLSYLKELYEIKNKEHEEDRRVADLEAKLAEKEESEEIYKSMFEIGVENNHSLLKEIEQLKQQLTTQENTITNLIEDNRASQEWYKKQLAESESRFQAHKQNDAKIIQDQTDLIEQLKQQLEEYKQSLKETIDHYEKYCSEINHQNIMLYAAACNAQQASQDKISFAVEQLEKVKELVEEKSTTQSPFGTQKIYASDVSAIIDNQIKQLKEMK